MATEVYSALRAQNLETLGKLSVLVEDLLKHASALPHELRTQLDTYHADIAAAIEDKNTARNKYTKESE